MEGKVGSRGWIGRGGKSGRGCGSGNRGGRAQPVEDRVEVGEVDEGNRTWGK